MANAEVGPTNRRMVTAATAAVMSVATAEVAGGGGEGAAQHAHAARAVVPRRMVAPTVKDKRSKMAFQRSYYTDSVTLFRCVLVRRGAKAAVEHRRHKRHTRSQTRRICARGGGKATTWFDVG